MHFFYVHFLCLPKENEPKEKAAVYLVPRCGTLLRCSKRANAPPNRFTALICAARLREMAQKIHFRTVNR